MSDRPQSIAPPPWNESAAFRETTLRLALRRAVRQRRAPDRDHEGLERIGVGARSERPRGADVLPHL